MTLWFGMFGGFPAGPAAVATGARIPDGAVDWRVVRVVVRDSCECCGDENVLLPLPSRELMPPPPVLAVPVFECPASEWMVSGFVATVGAAERVLSTLPFRALVLSSHDKMLPVSWDMEVRAFPADLGTPRRSD